MIEHTEITSLLGSAWRAQLVAVASLFFAMIAIGMFTFQWLVLILVGCVELTCLGIGKVYALITNDHDAR